MFFYIISNMCGCLAMRIVFSVVGIYIYLYLYIYIYIFIMNFLGNCFIFGDKYLIMRCLYFRTLIPIPVNHKSQFLLNSYFFFLFVACFYHLWSPFFTIYARFVVLYLLLHHHVSVMYT